MKSVIIADDSPIILDGIYSQISDMNIFDSITLVNNGPELLKKIREQNIDLLIIDVAMPKMSGFDVLKKIRLINHDVQILLISNFNGAEIKAKSLQLGANGFIEKINFVNDFYVAVKTLEQKKIYFTKDIITKAENQKSNYLSGLETSEIERKLSKREFEIFLQLGVNCESSEVAEKLNISKKTVDNHVEKIKKKLDIKSKHNLYRITAIHSYVYGNSHIKSIFSN